MKTLILAAFLPELEMIEHNFQNNKEMVCGLVGVGLTEATAKTTELLLQHRPQHVIFVGSCGSINTKYPLLSVVTAEKVFLADYLELNDKSYIPSIYRRVFEADENFLNSLDSKIIIGQFFTPLSITSDLASVENVFSKIGEFENLELFGVAHACEIQNVKWNNISVITNYLTLDAQKQWQEHYQEAAQLTAQILSKMFP